MRLDIETLEKNLAAFRGSRGTTLVEQPLPLRPGRALARLRSLWPFAPTRVVQYRVSLEGVRERFSTRPYQARLDGRLDRGAAMSDVGRARLDSNHDRLHGCTLAGDVAGVAAYRQARFVDLAAPAAGK